MKDLEGVTPVVEGAKPTPAEEVKPTKPEVKEPTVGKFTQEDIDRGIGKGLESINRQLTQSRTEATRDKARADKLQANVDKLMEDKFEDDPSGFKSYMREQKIAEREARAEERDREATEGATAMHLFNVASELSEKSGVPFGELKNLPDEKSMMDKVVEYLKKPKEPQEPTEPPPVIDSAISSASAESKLTAEQVKKMSPEERFARSKEIAEMPLGLGLK